MSLRKLGSMVLVMGFVCGLVLTTGCRKRKTADGGAAGPDLLTPDQIEGDYGMGGGRFEDGIRITDVKFESVLFEYDSYQVKSSETAKMEQVAAYMRTNAKVKLVVEGHCDERGSAEYNMALGEHRALAVRAYLIGIGIDAARIQTRSYGEERPAASGHDEASWRQNRRGEFALYK